MGVLISKIIYCISAYAGSSAQNLQRMKVCYNKCTRAIYGRYKDSEGRRIPLHVMRDELELLSFENLVKFFDITIFARIVHTGQPENLAKYILSANRVSRGFNKGNCRISFTPRTQKLKDTFLFRACQSFNCLPPELKTKWSPSFKDQVKSFLFFTPQNKI